MSREFLSHFRWLSSPSGDRNAPSADIDSLVMKAAHPAHQRALRRRCPTPSPTTAIALVFTIACAGCQKPARDPDTAVVLVAKDPEALDPRFAGSAVAVQLSHLVFAPLFTIGDDLAPAPYLAASYEQPDELTYDVTLRPGLTFHDGSPLTAQDVVFTYGHLGDEDVRSIHAGKYTNLEKVEALSDTHVRFTLKEPWAAFAIELCALGIVPARCAGRTDECRTSLVGSGAFMVETWNQAEERIVLQRNPRFFKGPPPIKRIAVRVVRNQTTRLLELIDENADLIIGDMSPTAVDVVKQNAHLAIQTAPGLDYSYMALNLRGPRGGDEDPEKARTRRALADVRVRRAIAHALHLDEVIATKLRGAARRATGMLPPGHWAKNEDLTPIPFDPQTARTLLDQAGFPDRGEDAGGRFSVVINTTPQRLRKSIALLFQDYLRDVGIDAKLRVAEWSTLYQEIRQGNFEMFSAKWTPVVEPDLMHWVFHSSNIPSPDHAGGNRGAYVDHELDRWIDEGRTMSDRKTRAPYYQKAEARLAEALPYVPLWFEDLIAVQHQRLTGFALTRTSSLVPLDAARLGPLGPEAK